jgi:hypothetical protein
MYSVRCLKNDVLEHDSCVGEGHVGVIYAYLRSYMCNYPFGCIPTRFAYGGVQYGMAGYMHAPKEDLGLSCYSDLLAVIGN